MGSCISWLAFPSDATSCAVYIGSGGALGAPLRSHNFAHVSTDTVDPARSRRAAVQSFEYVTSRPLLRFVILLQAHASLFTLRTWSYVSSVRYMVETEELGTDPSTAAQVFLMALASGSMLLVAVVLFVLQQNGAFWWVAAGAKSLCGNGQCCCFKRRGCCGCCRGNDDACARCLACICCIERGDERERNRRRMRSAGGGAMHPPSKDVVVSSDDSDRESSDEEDDEAVQDDHVKAFTSLRWRYPLTRAVASLLEFGQLDDEAPKTRAEREAEEAQWDRDDYEFVRYPVDADGAPLETEGQLTAATFARRGRLGPDPEAPQSERRSDETRSVMWLLLALWIPNAVMSGVDWFFYSRDPQNPSLNSFFWFSFIVGFVTAMAPPWYYWQRIVGRQLEYAARRDATSVYSERFMYRDLPTRTIGTNEDFRERREREEWLRRRQARDAAAAAAAPRPHSRAPSATAGEHGAEARRGEGTQANRGAVATSGASQSDAAAEVGTHDPLPAPPPN